MKKKATFTTSFCPMCYCVFTLMAMCYTPFEYRLFLPVQWISSTTHWTSKCAKLKWPAVCFLCVVFCWFVYIFIIFFSDGYTTEDLMFLWKEISPVQITTDLHLPRFTLEKYLTDYCTSTTNTGKRKQFFCFLLEKTFFCSFQTCWCGQLGLWCFRQWVFVQC